jgi:excisionase family DNA binding protein
MHTHGPAGGGVSEQTRVMLELPEAVVEAIAQRAAALALERLDRRESSPWMDLAQAATYLGFSRDRLYKLTAAGAVPCRRRPGGQRLLFHRDELDQWLETAWEREGWRG